VGTTSNRHHWRALEQKSDLLKLRICKKMELVRFLVKLAVP
jgi:hypothetical protein